MPVETSDAATLGALWCTVAILAAGFARSRGRSGLGWLLLVFFFGPLAALFLVLMREVPQRSSQVAARDQ